MLRADTEARCKKTGKPQLSQLSRVPQFVCFTSLAVSFMTQCHKCHNCPFTSLAVSFMTHCKNCHNCPFTPFAVSFMTQCHTCHNCPFTSLAVSPMTQRHASATIFTIVTKLLCFLSRVAQVSSSGPGHVVGGCSTFTSSWVVLSWPQCQWIQRPAWTTALPHSLQDLKMLRFQGMFWMMACGIFAVAKCR